MTPAHFGASAHFGACDYPFFPTESLKRTTELLSHQVYELKYTLYSSSIAQLPLPGRLQMLSFNYFQLFETVRSNGKHEIETDSL